MASAGELDDYSMGGLCPKDSIWRLLSGRISMSASDPESSTTSAQAITAAFFSGYSARFIAGATGVSLATARRWKAGALRPSVTSLRLWQLYRDMQVLTPSFRTRGFKVCGDALVDEAGKELTVGQLEWYQFMVAYAAELARRIGPDEQAYFWDNLMAAAARRA